MTELPINWQEAVARLARERALATTYARLLKTHGGAAAINSGAITYGEAKAEYDGIISGLIVALARKKQPTSLTDLQARLELGFTKREAFCLDVKALLPHASGQKGFVEEAVKGAIEPLVQAVKEIFLRAKDDDVLARKTIETQLAAASWEPFATIGPAS